MSTIAPVDDNSEATPLKKLVKVSVTIDEAEFDRDIDTAFDRLATKTLDWMKPQ